MVKELVLTLKFPPLSVCLLICSKVLVGLIVIRGIHTE